MKYDKTDLLIDPDEHEIDAMAVIENRHGYTGMKLAIFEDDHQPPHFHVLDQTNQTVARVILTKNSPKNTWELKLIKGSILTTQQQQKIVTWARQKPFGTDLSNWGFAKATWKINNNNDTSFPTLRKAQTIWGHIIQKVF